MPVLVWQIFVTDQAFVLYESADVSTCACEAIEYVNVAVSEILVELTPQCSLNHVQLSVNYFDGSVDDSEAVGGVFEGLAEELSHTGHAAWDP